MSSNLWYEGAPCCPTAASTFVVRAEGPYELFKSISCRMFRSSTCIRYFCSSLQDILNRQESPKSSVEAHKVCSRIGMLLLILRRRVWLLRSQVSKSGTSRDLRQFDPQSLEPQLQCQNLEQCVSLTEQLTMRLYFHYCTRKLILPNYTVHVEDLDHPRRIMTLTRECFEYFPIKNSIEGWKSWMAEGKTIWDLDL